MQNNKNNTAFGDSDEIEKFASLAEDWWNPHGKMKPLHRFNPVRIDYIKQQLCTHYNLDKDLEQPLQGLKILDVGCGGGLLSESLAILGAEVVGIDATDKMIQVAKLHSKQSGVAVDYRNVDVKQLAESAEKFDAVMTLEVVEHVSDPENFLKTCCACTKNGGAIMVSTMNRTIKAYALAIVGAEYVLRWLPKGTHDWHKFLKPSEICHMVRNDNITPQDMTGIVYSPFEDAWKISKEDLEVNYIIHFTKQTS